MELKRKNIIEKIDEYFSKQIKGKITNEGLRTKFNEPKRDILDKIDTWGDDHEG